MADALIGASIFAWAPFGCFVVGALYIAMSTRSVGLLRRLVAASYAPVAAVIYLAIAFALPRYQSQAALPVYIGVQLVPVGLLLVSLRWFSGPRWVHAVLVPVALLCMLWQFTWGYLGVFGE
jgi:hypothetical protein